MVSKNRTIFEDLVRQGSFRWLVGNRSSFDEEFEELEQTPTVGKSSIAELSPFANIVVQRCSKVLGVPVTDLQKDFDAAASDSLKDPLHYSRNLLEYCCFRALALSAHVTGHLDDKKFRRLTFDMMVAWEAPAASSRPVLNVDDDATVGRESFSRIAPAIPVIANVIIVENLFEVLTSSTSGRLQYPTYEKYLIGLERALKKLKSQSKSSLLSDLRSDKREKILEVDGTVTTQPVLQHVGVSTWPGRLTLTDHALYFEPLRVVSFDKAQRYDLDKDLKQIVKPEMTGPWGTRLFDKAVSYKSIVLSEPVLMEFPELKGNTRRDYWLAIIEEILLAHRFLRKFQLTGVEGEEALLLAVFGILRLQAIQELNSIGFLHYKSLLIFSLCDNLPGGYSILENLADRLASRGSKSPRVGSGMYSISALAMASSLGIGFGSNNGENSQCGLLVGEIAVGDSTSLEKAVKQAKVNYEKVVLAQETVNGVKVDGIDSNLAVMKELLLPLFEIGKFLHSILFWEDPLKSIGFCMIFSYIFIWGLLSYLFASMMILFATFMVMSRICTQGQRIDEVHVVAPIPKSKVEQLLAVQNVVSQAEEILRDGNIVLLKLRALMISIFPQASEKCAFALLLLALILAFVPSNYVLALFFLEFFTRYSPPRKASSERIKRRMREWWFSIPAAPVVVKIEDKDKKKK